MRILTLTTLYPNIETPSHGVFVENRLRHFTEKHKAEVTVIAPVPYFPFKSTKFKSYARFARIPRKAMRHGIEIYHPRYLLVPKIGMTLTTTTLAHCFKRQIENLSDNGYDFDLIDAHYYYPDGVAAAKITKNFSKPLVITARGTDINLIPKYKKQRAMVLRAAQKADASITVCQALKDEMISLGCESAKINVMRNGVDLTLFRPQNRDKMRNSFGLTGPILLSVGHLIERKGHDLAIHAAAKLPDTTLLIAGSGPEESNLKSLADSLGISDRVRFLGRLAHEKLPDLYSASDLLILGSSREGWPNVLLESMACGTPCVAPPIWGCGEVITTPESGCLANERTTEALITAIHHVFSTGINRSATRAYAEQFSWDETTDSMNALFTSLIQKNMASYD